MKLLKDEKIYIACVNEVFFNEKTLLDKRMKVKQAVCPHADHGATTQTRVNTLDPAWFPKKASLCAYGNHLECLAD